MQPERRLVDHFDDQCRANDDEAGNQDHENGRAIAGIRKGVIEPARVASLTQAEETGKQASLATTGTAPGKPGHDRLRQRRFFGHAALSGSSSEKALARMKQVMLGATEYKAIQNAQPMADPDRSEAVTSNMISPAGQPSSSAPR